jgi:hypothetical protein
MPQFATLWSIPCTTHTLTLGKFQIMWNYFTSQSTLIQVNQINMNLKIMCSTLTPKGQWKPKRLFANLGSVF